MKAVFAFFASSENKASFGAWFRKKRFKIFEQFIEKNFPNNVSLNILDIGGKSYFWKDTSLLQRPNTKIVLLNLSDEKVDHPFLISQVGDATNLDQFNDHHFDLVFSNSVIEHLYTQENQLKMAKECMRVGHKYFIQTPNKHFFIEPHYALPLFQYLPKSVKYFILTKLPLSKLQKWNPVDAKQYLDEILLLSKKDVKLLFPQSKIYKEKFLGMTKSFTAHNM
jgi:hypothetical protein